MNYHSDSQCPCCSGQTFNQCCEPVITGEILPANPEILMRSRYSAYAIKQYDYILDTYTQESRPTITTEQLACDNQSIEWVLLTIHVSEYTQHTGFVEFSAYYHNKRDLFLLRERSNFINNNERWLYSDGMIDSTSGKVKLQRNKLCICGSGKKVKVCCMRAFV